MTYKTMVLGSVIWGVLAIAVSAWVRADTAERQQQLGTVQVAVDVERTLTNVFSVSGECRVLKETPVAGQDALNATVEGEFIERVQRLSRHEFRIVFKDEYKSLTEGWQPLLDKLDIRDMRHARSCRGRSPF